MDSIKKIHFSLDDWKNSKDIIERTVWFIATLSPHNLWKGDEAIRNLIQSLRKSDMEAVEEMIDGFDYYCNDGECCSGDMTGGIRSKLKEYREKNNI